MSRRPNVVFIRTDSQDGRVMGCMGHPATARATPNLDALAAHRPEVVGEVDARLREIVDYEAVDAEVKDYDRRSFRRWRSEQKAAGTYEQTMARVYSGWDGVADEDVRPWTRDDEAAIDR